MNWLELHIDTNHGGLDTVETMLSSLGIDGVVIDDELDFQDFLENNHQYWDYVDEELLKKDKTVVSISGYMETNENVLAVTEQLKIMLPQDGRPHIR